MYVPFSCTSHLLMPLFGRTGRVVKMSMFQVQGGRGVEWGTLFESVGKRGKEELGLNWLFTFSMCVRVGVGVGRASSATTHPDSSPTTKFRIVVNRLGREISVRRFFCRQPGIVVVSQKVDNHRLSFWLSFLSAKDLRRGQKGRWHSHRKRKKRYLTSAAQGVFFLFFFSFFKRY